MTDRNIGKFRIPSTFVSNTPERVAEVFALLKIVPVRCEHLYMNDELEYIALSDRFPEVEPGRIVPEYVLEITQGSDGNIELVEVKPYY